MLAAQKDSESKELEAKLHQERMDSTFQRDMLQYLIQDQVDIQIDENLFKDREGNTTTHASYSDHTQYSKPLHTVVLLGGHLLYRIRQNGALLYYACYVYISLKSHIYNTN